MRQMVLSVSHPSVDPSFAGKGANIPRHVLRQDPCSAHAHNADTSFASNPAGDEFGVASGPVGSGRGSYMRRLSREGFFNDFTTFTSFSIRAASRREELTHWWVPAVPRHVVGHVLRARARSNVDPPLPELARLLPPTIHHLPSTPSQPHTCTLS